MNDTITKYQKMIERNPGNELARFSLAKAHYDASEFEAAKNHFEIALDHKPDWMIAQILLGKCHIALGDRRAAREAFQRGHQLAMAQAHDGPREEMEALLAELDED